MGQPRLPRDEVTASLATGRDLGPEYDDQVAAALSERLDRIVEERVRTEVEDRAAANARGSEARVEARTSVAIASLIFAVPLSAIAAGTAGGLGLLFTWLGIVIVNVVLVWEPRRHRS